MVRNTGLGFISGRFSNLAQGQVVTLTYQGEAYQFAANYYGGTGNDLVLQWANIRAYGWGNNALGQLGNNSITDSSVPVDITRSGVLASGAASGPLTLGPGATAITVAVTAEDGITITSYSISVDNFAPVFGGYAVATAFQKPVSVHGVKLLAKASDPDGDVLAVTATGPAANGGTAVVQGSSVLYTPANNFSGADTFPVTITDARGATVVGTVTVTVGSGPSAGGVGANPPVLTVLPDGKMALAFQGIPGRSYIVQRSASGLDNWVTLATIPADASGKVAYTDESPPAGSAFYRLGMQ